MADRSPFRTGFLKPAFFIGGTWVQVAMTELGDDGVTITRGRSGEGARDEPSSCTFRLKDPTGKWSPRNPTSPYYGLFGRGTAVRIQVEMTAGVTVDRWYGEVVTVQPRWERTGEPSAHVEVEAAGVLRRIGQGESPLASPLRRAISGIGANLAGYWPMEDDEGSTAFGAAVAGGRPATWVGTPTLAADETFAAAQPLPVLGTAKVTAQVTSYATSTQAQIRWVARIPASTATTASIIDVTFTGGTLGRIRLNWDTTSSGRFVMIAYDRDGDQVGAYILDYSVAGGLQNRLIRYSLEVSQSGSDVSANVAVYENGAASGTVIGGTFPGVTIGRAATVTLNPDRSNLAGPVGHLSVERVITSLFSVSVAALAGHTGERAPARVARLAAENGLTSTVTSSTLAVRMGVQRARTLPDLLQECVSADGGILYEPRSTTDIAYRPLESLWTQVVAPLEYVENMFAMTPVEDDAGVRNRVTVTRDGGGEATIEQAAGPLGTAKVGVYDESVTLNLERDEQVRQQASWRVAVGTHDDARWPSIAVDLADPRIAPDLRDTLLGLDLGDLVELVDLPAWLPPVTVRQLVIGQSETITPLSYRLSLVCAPAAPYDVARYRTTGTTARWSTDGTVTAEALDATETGVTVTVGRVRWAHDDGNYQIVIGGEEMTVTAVTAPSGGQQTFTVVRSVNGVVKTHLTGAAVDLAALTRYGLQGD